jgi:hypothetical protein
MAPLTIMTAEGSQTLLNCLFSRDWPQAFIHAWFAEATRLPITEFGQSYQTPRGRIDCTRSIRTLIKPEGLNTFTAVEFPILEAEIYPHHNLPVIMGRPQVEYFLGPDWPHTETLQPLVQLDFSPRPLVERDFSPRRHAYTFPFTPAMYEPLMTTEDQGGFYNYDTPPSLAYTPGQQHQAADFPQVGQRTLAGPNAAGELSRHSRTQMWVEDIINNSNAPSPYVTTFPR